MSEQEKRAIINTFEKGMVCDLDVSRTDNKSFVNARNVRLFKNSNGLIVTNIAGNHYSETDEIGFHISEGYIPLGGIEFNGFLYIFSCYATNLLTKEYHIGEIGMFPSYDSLGALERVYRPLQNLKVAEQDSGTLTAGTIYKIEKYESGDSFTNVGAESNMDGVTFRANGTTPTVWTNGSLLYECGDFNTDQLMFKPTNQIEVVPWQIVDGSVNLYFTDNFNPIRCINAGYLTDGTPNGMTYREDDFPNAVSLILSTNNYVGCVLKSGEATHGGRLMGGNYFFFFRFLNRQMNSTHFLLESGVVQVNDGETIQMSEGTSKVTSRKVAFTLSNLDKSYDYVQVAYVRYFSGEDGNVVFETALVDKDYPLPRGDEDTMTVTVTGSEGTRIITLDDILYQRPEDDTCQSITTLENRLWGANWKGTTVFHQSMIDFAKLIVIGYDDTDFMAANPFDPSDLCSSGQYKDRYYTWSNLGYFRGETYPFAIRYELLNGFLTEAFPLLGQDELNLLDGTNTDGIYRFPDNETSPFYKTDLGDGYIYVMKVTIDLQDALQAVFDSSDADGIAWIRNNVRAFHLVRGERYKTMEFQGLAINGCAATTDQEDDYTLTRQCSLGSTAATEIAPGQYDEDDVMWTQTLDDYTDSDNVADTFWGSIAEGSDMEAIQGSVSMRENLFIPLYRGYAPLLFKDKQRDNDESDQKKTRTKVYCSRFFLRRDKVAVFSPDHMLGRLSDVSGIVRIERVFSTIGKTYSEGNGEGGWDHNEGDLADYSDTYPRWTKAELETPTVFSERIASDLTVFSVGDGVDHLPQSPSGPFVNKAKDFWASDVETMFYATRNLDEHVWSNRSIVTPKYIGLDIADDLEGDDYNLDIVSLYNCDFRGTAITSFFPNRTGIRYSRIATPFSIDWDALTQSAIDAIEPIPFGGGDCFPQRSYFKLNAYSGTSFYADGWDFDIAESETVCDFGKKYWRTRDDYVPAKFSYGVIVSIITENACNVAMRGIDGDHSYYPKISSAEGFARRCHSSIRSESFVLNHGYSRTLSPKQSIGYDKRFIVNYRQRSGRIRFSDLNDGSSIIDGFRFFRQNNFVDFPVLAGSIKKIIELYGMLVSIQEKSINQHYTSERQVQSLPSSSELVFGKGDILSDKIKVLANFGSQHQWSIAKTDTSVYGVDYNMRKIWKLGKVSEMGYMSLGVIDLSKETLISSYVKKLFDRWDKYGDIARVYQDNPVRTEGIFTVWDPKNEEVLFIFSSKVPTEFAGDKDIVIPFEETV